MPHAAVVIPALTGGVTQQPEAISLANQLREQTNAWTSLVDVTRPRHPTEHLARVFQDVAGKRGGPALLHALDRGDQEQYLFVLGNADPRVFDAQSGSLIPVKARQSALIVLNTLPADNSQITVDGLPAGTAKNFIFDGTATPADSDPNYYINTGAGQFDTKEKAAAELARKITAVTAANADAYAHGATVMVIDRTVGDNSALAAKSGGDSATSIKLVIHPFQKFLAMRAFAPQSLPLVTPDDLSDNTGSTQTSPTSAGPFTEADRPWRSFGTALTAEYNTTDAGQLGPYGGGHSSSMLRAVADGNSQEAYWYHRFVKPSQPSYLNRFAPSGTWQVVSGYYIGATSATPLSALGLGFLNATSSAWKRVDFAVNSLDQVTGATGMNGAVGAFEDLGFGWFRLWAAYKTADVTEEGQERRLGFYMSLPSNGMEKRARVYGVTLEHTTGRTIPSRFLYKPHEGNRLLSLANSTYWLNVASTVAMDTSRLSAAQVGDEAYLWVRQVNYDSVYGVKIKQGANGAKAATVTTTGSGGGTETCAMFKPTGALSQASCEETAGNQDYTKGVHFAGSGANRCSDVSTSGVALNLALRDDGALQAQEGLKAKWTIAPFSTSNTVEVNGSVIRLTSPNAIDEIQVWDSFGGDSLVKIHKSVPSLEFLPKYGPCKDGFKVKVEGDEESDQDDFWMIFVADTAGAFGPGHWEQTIAYSTQRAFDPTTMPWQLVPKLDDAAGTVTTKGLSKYIEASIVAWDERQVGDATTNRNPSLVGQSIRDMYFFRGRLGFLTGISVVCSRSNSFFNFFRTDIAQLLDDDRVDGNVPGKDVATLLHAIPFEKSLSVFSKTTRFTVGGTPFTQKTMEANPVEYEEVFEFARPHAMARSIFFARPKGDYSGIKEFFPSEEGESSKSFNLTGNVSQYIRGEVVQVTGSTLEDVVAVLGDGEPRYVYLFKFHDSGQQRAQAAWHRYDFGADAKVRGVQFIGSWLYLLIERKYDVYLERMRITDKAVDPGLNWQALHDRRVTENTPGVSRSYNAIADTTTFTLPYRLDVETVDGVRCRNRETGESLTPLSVGLASSVSTFTVAGDQREISFYAGQPYTMRVSLHPILREQRGQGQSAPTTGDRTTEFAYLSYHDAADGSFRVLTTTKQDGEQQERVHSSADLEDDEIEVGVAPNISRYTGRMPIGAGGYPEQLLVAIESTSDLPFYLSKIEFPTYLDREAASRG